MTRADVTSVVVLNGVVVQDPSVTVQATIAGTIASVAVSAGGQVHAGDPVAFVQPSNPALAKVAIKADLDGMVASIDVVPGQDVAVGLPLAEVRPPAFQAVATVDPSLLYRFYGGPPLSLRVQIDKGPAPFDCAFLSLGIPPSASGAAVDPTSEPIQMRCRIPHDQRVFAGVRCLLAATTGSAKDAVVIPLTAVEGSADSGYVTRIGAGGKESTVLVRLGLSDGVQVQVLSGLAAGDRILNQPPSLGSAPAGSASQPSP